MRSLNENKVLIVNNRPPNSGIGRYTTELVKALTGLISRSRYINGKVNFIIFLFNKAVEKRNFLTLCFEEALLDVVSS
jgi:hypothetical protein